MKSKTKKQFQRWVLYALIGVFVAGTLLLYLPLGQSQPQNTPPPLNTIPGVQNQPDAGGQIPPGAVPVQPNAAQGGQSNPGQAGQPPVQTQGGNPLSQ